MSISMYAPAANQEFVCRSGNTYTSDANKVVAAVVTQDVVDLTNLGCFTNPYYVRKYGTFTCNGTTAVTIADASAAVTDLFQCGLNTVGGTVGALPHLATLTVSSQVTTVGTASDTSVYNYSISSLR